MSQPTNKPTEKPDPATSYERAKPKQQSPSGKLEQPPAPPAKERDHLQGQNPNPRKHPNTEPKSTEGES